MLGIGFRDKMMLTMGGTKIVVSMTEQGLYDGHALLQILGRVGAEELVSIMPGERFYVPHGRPKTVGSRSKSVAELVLSGQVNTEIVRRLGISTRQVGRHRAKAGLNGQALAARLNTNCNNLADSLILLRGLMQDRRCGWARIRRMVTIALRRPAH